MLKTIIIAIVEAILNRVDIKSIIEAQLKSQEIKKDLKNNEKKSEQYQNVVKSETSTREERAKAEDELLK